MQYYIGIDIGGTNTKAILLEKNKIISSAIMATNKKNHKKLIRGIINAIETVSRGKRILAAGIALPGILDGKKTMILKAPNLRAIEKVQLKKILEKKFGYHFFLENDAKTAAFSEQKNGAGKRAKKLLLLTIGTGIGSGIVNKGKIVSGKTELGHFIIEKNGFKCGCGKKGCFETIANSAFIERTAKSLAKKQGSIMKKFDPISVEIAAKKHDLAAVETYYQLAENIAKGISVISKKIKPDCIILAGGISNNKTLYPILEKITGKKIKKAKLGYFAGAIGAAMIAMQQNKKTPAKRF